MGESESRRGCRENKRHGVIWHQAFLDKFCFLQSHQISSVVILRYCVD